MRQHLLPLISNGLKHFSHNRHVSKGHAFSSSSKLFVDIIQSIKNTFIDQNIIGRFPAAGFNQSFDGKMSSLSPTIHNSGCLSSLMFLRFCAALTAGADSLSLAKVALGKPTAQGPGVWVNTEWPAPKFYQCGLAVDGREATHHLYCTHSTLAEPVWWMVDLQAANQIHRMAVLNRDTHAYRLQNFAVDIFHEDSRTLSGFPDTLGRICSHQKAAVGESLWAELQCRSGFLTGRLLRVIKWNADSLSRVTMR